MDTTTKANTGMAAITGIVLGMVMLVGIGHIFSTTPYSNKKTVLASTVTTPPTTTSISGIWISPAEIMALPMSGSAWDNVRTTAYGSWGTPDLSNQSIFHGPSTIAGALVWVRTGDNTLRVKVRDAIMAAKRTLDSQAEYDLTARTLSLGRQLGAYVIAADLIDLPTFDPTADAEFRPWLSSIRTQVLPQSNSNWQTLTITHEKAANNWGTFAGASRIAASLYLGDAADVDRAANVFRAWLGERSFYPAGLSWGTYFKPTANWSTTGATWACDPVNWIAVNPPCIKSGVDSAGTPFSLDVNGALVEDISRGGALSPTPGSDGHMYSWEVLAGVYAQAEMLYRAGYPDTYDWSNQALKRAMNFMVRMGWHMTNPSQYVPWIANYRYGATYPTTSPFPRGRIMSWTDWTHNSSGAPPTCIESWTCGGWSACVNSSQSRTCTDNNNCGTTANRPALTQSCSSGADTTAPTVTITAPTNGATVAGTVTFSATADDNIGVAGVTFYVNGAALWPEVTTTPYIVQWDTTMYANGDTATLTAMARDVAGNTITSPAISATINQSAGCTENWICGSWSPCVSGSQNRICTDTNSCGTTVDRPDLSQSCLVPDTVPPAVIADLRTQ